MLKWIRRWFANRRWLRRSYDCDGCGRCTPRREGKALVRTTHEMLKPLPEGPLLGGLYWHTRLYCPQCAVQVKAGERSKTVVLGPSLKDVHSA